jgi:hypothetical protein
MVTNTATGNPPYSSQPYSSGMNRESSEGSVGRGPARASWLQRGFGASCRARRGSAVCWRAYSVDLAAAPGDSAAFFSARSVRPMSLIIRRAGRQSPQLLEDDHMLYVGRVEHRAHVYRRG